MFSKDWMEINKRSHNGIMDRANRHVLHSTSEGHTDIFSMINQCEPKTVIYFATLNYIAWKHVHVKPASGNEMSSVNFKG